MDCVLAGLGTDTCPQIPVSRSTLAIFQGVHLKHRSPSVPGCPWNHKAAKQPRITAKFSFAAKSSQNSQTYFILHDPVQEAGSGSHEHHTEEEVKKRRWGREPFCPKLHLGEVASTIEFDIVAQSFRICKSLCGLCLSYLIFNKSLGFGTNYLLGRQITLIS